jgi:hypothetical protein
VEEVPTMHRDAGIGLLRRTAFPPGEAGQVAVPPAVHACSTLSHLDHEDAVIVEVGPDQERAGEQWPERSCRSLPIITRAALWSGWLALGLWLGAARSADRSSASRRLGEKEPDDEG